MGLGEHVLDPLAGPDVPVGNIMLLHLLLPFLPACALFLCDLSLSDILHDLECMRALDSHLYKIGHDIISCTDRCRYGRGSFLDEDFGISLPYVCSVRESRYPYKIGKCLGSGIYEHLHGKLRAKLGYSETPQRCSAHIIGCYT